MYFLVVIVSKAAIARRRAIASFCDSNSLLNHLSETAAILSNESSYMASTTRNSVVKNDGINQLVVIYDLVEAALNIVSLNIHDGRQSFG